MTNPPNRIGGARGPGGTTNDDILAAINTTNILMGELGVQISSLTAFLDSIAGDMRYFVGDPANRSQFWNGISGTLGANNEGPNGSIWASLFFLGFVLNDIDGKLQQIAGASNLTNGKLDLIRGTPAGDLGMIAQVLGDIEGAPLGSTIKDLLRSIDVNQARAADCCEDGGVEPEPTETEPPGPDFRCALSDGPLRTTGYFFWRNLPGDGFDEYIPLWDGLEAASGGLVAPLNSFDLNPIPAIFAPETVTDVCFEWNLLDGQVPAQVAIYTSSSAGEFVGQVPSLPTITIGPGSTGVEELDPEFRPKVFVLRVAEGTGAPAHNNYWLRWEAQPS